MKTDIWMPFYIGDFVKKTLHLSSEEKGLYLLILVHLWNNQGSIEIDKLRKTLNFSPKKFEKKMKNLFTFFSKNDGKLSQKRLLEEYEKSQKNRLKKQEAGKKGGFAKSKNVADGKAKLKQKASPSPSPSPSPSYKEKNKSNRAFSKPTVKEIRDYCMSRKNEIDPEQFFDHYEARNWQLSKGVKMKDWKACMRTWEKNNYNKKRENPFAL